MQSCILALRCKQLHMYKAVKKVTETNAGLCMNYMYVYRYVTTYRQEVCVCSAGVCFYIYTHIYIYTNIHICRCIHIYIYIHVHTPSLGALPGVPQALPFAADARRIGHAA